MLLGCSNMTGRYWIGSLWYYRDPNEAPSVEKAWTGLDCDNGVVEGIFVGKEGNNVSHLTRFVRSCVTIMSKRSLIT
jgi:hypothetical protein